MDPISNIDRLVMVLRQRILDRSKSDGKGRASSGTSRGSIDSIRALAAVDAVDDHQLRRALVQNILADQFGHDLANEPKFQQVVERVTEALEDDENGSALINRFVRELRDAAK